jgi:hypothetical protein
MGLDMYLSVRQYVARVDFSAGYDDKTGWAVRPEFTELVDSVGMSKFLQSDSTTGAYVEVPVAYWRKANAIHKWFIDNRADGIDECQPISAHVSHLKELLELCEQVLADNDLADELLPTEVGFFFGGTEYDESYFQDIQYTKDRLTEVVRLMEETPEADWCHYQASW